MPLRPAETVLVADFPTDQDQRVQLLSLVEEHGLLCADPGASVAIGGEYLMMIESTLGRFASEVARVHSVPLDGVTHTGPAGRVLNSDEPGGAASIVEPLGVVGPRSIATVIQNGEVGDRDLGVRVADAGVGPRAGGPVNPYGHMTRRELVEVLRDGLDRVLERGDSPVLQQGAPVFANLQMSGPNVCGFRDWAAIHVGDRHWDLAVASRDIVRVCGPNGLAVFFESYGHDLVDPIRLDWYSLAVELLS